MTNAISFSLFGSTSLYTHGMIRNAELAPSVYPGWKVIVYASATVPEVVTTKLEKLGAEIRGAVKGVENEMFWRFCAVGDDQFERVIIRDADSRLNKRESAAVGHWIESGLDWHVMRDHPNHWLPISGGMWGVKTGVVDMKELIIKSGLASRTYDFKSGYSLDQTFLSTVIWPIARKSCLQHDSCNRHVYPEAQPFPNGMNSDRFVGEIFETDDKPRVENWMMRCNWKYAE